MARCGTAATESNTEFLKQYMKTNSTFQTEITRYQAVTGFTIHTMPERLTDRHDQVLQ